MESPRGSPRNRAAQQLNLPKSTPRHVAGNVPAENQAREALKWLGERQEERYSAYLETMYQGSTSPALVFARKRTTKTLREHGLLTLMDSTHNTNRGKWSLYTLLVRDEHSSWIPCAHFFTKLLEAGIIVECLESPLLPRYVASLLVGP
ncbi:hypothetical protein V8E54_002395 [Elaphomyces granulatus]